MNAPALCHANGLSPFGNRSSDHRAAVAALAAPALALALLLSHAPAYAAGGADGPTGSALLTDLLGYAAAVLVFVTFYLRSIVHIRIAAVCSNLLFIGYASSAELAPILVLHAMLLPLNLWRLRELAAGRQVGGTVPMGGPGRIDWRALLARLRGAGPTTRAGARGGHGHRDGGARPGTHHRRGRSRGGLAARVGSGRCGGRAARPDDDAGRSGAVGSSRRAPGCGPGGAGAATGGGARPAACRAARGSRAVKRTQTLRAAAGHHGWSRR
jgi:hypothetical protein